MDQKKLYPVIHCADPFNKGGIGHALANARTAKDNSADGVFLIGHGMQYSDLILIYNEIRKQCPDLWIGINFLDIGASGNWINLFKAVRSCVELNGLWLDMLPDLRLDLPRTIQVFGGVAFKYRNPTITGTALEAACGKAVRTVDVVTTSGEETGSPPSVEKIQEIRGLLDRYSREYVPLAVASGLDDKNVVPMLPYIDAGLVATSLNRRDAGRNGLEFLVPERVRTLADVFHSYRSQ